MATTPDDFVDLALDIEGLGAARGAAEPALELEPPVPHRDVIDTLTSLDKAIRSRRLYHANNPTYRSFVGAAQAAFRSLLERVPDLTLSVEEHAFRWYGRAFSLGEGRETLPFLFYKDGVRFISFLPGFEEELEHFLDTVDRARVADHLSQDDMVTLLWQADLACFRYTYVDALAEGLTIPVIEAAPAQMIDVTLRDLDLAGGVPGEARPPAVEAGQPPLADLISRSGFEETLYFLEAQDLEVLRTELEMEFRRDCCSDVIDALFDRLEDQVPEWRTEVLQVLRQLLPMFLGAGELVYATRIVVELTAVLKKGVLGEEHAADAAALFRELGEAPALAQLFSALEDGSIEPDTPALAVFLGHLGPESLPMLLATAERSERALLRDRLAGAVDTLGRERPAELLALLGHADPLVARGAVRAAGRLQLGDGVAAVVTFLDSADTPLRRACVESLVQMRSAASLEAVQRCLADGDRDVRITAARGLAALRYVPARQRLAQLLESRQVRDADLTEKIAFFEAFGSVATPESVAMLDRMLNGRRLFSRQSPELRACAARALGRVGSPAARASLQRSAADPSAVVRNAVAQALRQERGAA